MYRVWYYLQFQASTRVLECIPHGYCNALSGIESQRMCKIDCYGEQEGGTGLTGIARVVTTGEIYYNSGSRIQRKTWLRFAKVSLWMFVNLRGIEKSLN